MAGIGKLGAAMMAHWNEENIQIGIYHPSRTKAEQFIRRFPNGYLLNEQDLREVDILILALPAGKVIPFMENIAAEALSSSVIFINMATALPTKVVCKRFPSYNVYGIKYMGHSRDLLEHGNGLFITEEHLPEQVMELYKPLGKINKDGEDRLVEINKLATYYAVKTAVEIEKDFTNKGYPSAYIKRALTSLAPEVIRSYSEGNLGHFAQEIVREIKESSEKDAD
nr:NAD(P)-binding domain-containing protein [Bacillus sp. ISL-47]